MSDLISQEDQDSIKNTNDDSNHSSAFTANTQSFLASILTNVKIVLSEKDKEYLVWIESKINNPDTSLKEKSYYKRIFNVLNMPDLSIQEGHPINMVLNKIVEAGFFKDFYHSKSPEIVREWETFDLFNFPKDHVARRPSDTYFLNKSDNPKESVLLRPHTSVMWYYYLIDQWWRDRLFQTWETEALSSGKVYRVDKLDKTHHECFYQIDGLKIVDKEKEILTQDTLKNVLIHTIEALYGKWIEYRFLEDKFPYTVDSLQAEVNYKWKWVEVLWAGIVHPTVLSKLWIDSDKYNWRAFWFWLDRLTMAFKWIPDIRIFWSTDKRITSQWGNLDQYKQISVFPPVYKDISMIVPKNMFLQDKDESEKSWAFELTNDSESNFFAINWTIKDIGWDLIEEIKIMDLYQNDAKFWAGNESLSIRITFRSIERTLTNEEINKMYFEIRKKIERELSYGLR